MPRYVTRFYTTFPADNHIVDTSLELYWVGAGFSTMSLLKFFIRGPLPLNKIGLLGLLYAAKQTALKQNRDTLYILIRSGDMLLRLLVD